MKRLILMRHAKSDWGTGLPDFDRPLNQRGRQDAPRMADWLEREGFVPEAILCSAATRTRQTQDYLNEKFATAGDTAFKNLLYHAPPETILSYAQQADDTYSVVMVLAHNPGIHDAAMRFLSDKAVRHDNYMGLKFPTAAIAVIEFPIQSWAELTWRTGTLMAFQVPRELDA